MSNQAAPPPVPTTFWQYIRSMGPGIVIVLTWLGAGDLVDAAVAGGNYGYALMWALMLALLVRFIFVSILAKYQLCNQHGESVMSGFQRIHPYLPIFFAIVAFLLGHFYGSYMVKGAGEAFSKMVGFGQPWAWSIFWVCLVVILCFKGVFSRIEIVFFVFLGLLSVSLIGVAAWSGPSPVEAFKGVFLFSMPEDTGSFGVLLVVTSLIGAVGGSITNLFYPYFIDKKNWRGPKYRKLQLYDLAFGVCVLIILDLAIWTVGAEILHPTGKSISDFDDLAGLLNIALGKFGGAIFYLGVFGAVITSAIGNALGFGYLVGDVADQRNKAKGISSSSAPIEKSRLYKIVVVWTLFSPLIWTIPGAPGFVELTIIVNAASVVVLPVLSASIWYITSRKNFIGTAYRNKWWEHAVMGFLFALAIWASWNSVYAIAEYL
ncbi:MAG: Nramp family divalent metal transporter [Verrucomicrobia bacterium]|nr:Nramp family divalent metal transporter [Verrucomicrobiota bacterium]